MLYELLIVFLISFAVNATPFIGLSYTLVATSFLTKVGVTPYNFLLFTIVSGVGAGLAKNFMYLVGVGLRRPMKHNRNMQFLDRFVKTRSYYVAAAILAAIPFFPFDDYLFLGAGIARAPLLKLNLIVTLVKVVRTGGEIYIELLGLNAASSALSFLGISEFDLGILSSVFFLILGIVLVKVDWENLYLRAREVLGRGR